MSTTSEDPKDAVPGWNPARLFRSRPIQNTERDKTTASQHPKWSFGVLNDKQTLEVPGSVLLLPAYRNEPLGVHDDDAPPGHVENPLTRAAADDGKKKTEDGTIILDPQPEDSHNDPLNWPHWRRDSALLSLGLYCMVGGGITSIMAAGFTDVAHDFGVSVETVSLTVGLYMMGLGIGSVIASPTAILYGKRPVYLGSVILFIATCIWSGYASSFPSLLAARVFQGMAVSPVECLPSATIAEIYFLHERAYRIGIYTLLLLGGKNLIPLVSAAVIGRFGWRWVFFIVSMVAAAGFVLLFLFVPETFWDRMPTRTPTRKSSRPSFLRRLSSRRSVHVVRQSTQSERAMPRTPERPHSPGAAARHGDGHVGFVAPTVPVNADAGATPEAAHLGQTTSDSNRHVESEEASGGSEKTNAPADDVHGETPAIVVSADGLGAQGPAAAEPAASPDTNGPLVHVADEHARQCATSPAQSPPRTQTRGERTGGPSPCLHSAAGGDPSTQYPAQGLDLDPEKAPASALGAPPEVRAYTHKLRRLPAQTFVQQLKPYHGRLTSDSWLKVMVRPFVLLTYPAVLWSSAVYACSIGWLIVISETMAIIYRDPATYNFTALQTGLVYISPFVGGVLGTGVAGKVSDVMVRAMSRRNGGVYEPEFRLVMAAPIAVTTTMGLMGFGWSAEARDHWMVPTVFFGVLSFGCSLGSTTAITFCVDSYRQYAGEALVTLNFCKNVLHGLVFSLFVSHWMAEEGPRRVYMWLGVMQLVLQVTTVPLFVYGKRARMWTVGRNAMERF